MSTKKLICVILPLTTLMLNIGTDPSVTRAAPARPNEFVSGPSPASPRLGPEFQISPPGDSIDYHHPAVAYDIRHDEYLVVFGEKWSNGSRHIGARRVLPSGPLFGWTTFPSNLQELQPTVAYNYTDDQYLIVWMDDPTGAAGSNSPYDIWGIICPYDVWNCGSPFLIFHWPNRGFWTPRVAWNSYRDEYFVIWNAMDTNTGLPSDVAGVHVSTSGVPDSLAHIITSANYPQQADLAYDPATDQYLVVWRRMWTSGDWDIWGATVNHDGSLDGGAFTINASFADQQSPRVTTNQQNRYFVVWQQRASGLDPWQIIGQELDVYGNAVGGTTSPGNGVVTVSSNQTNPAVVAKPGLATDYFVVWQQTSSTGEDVRACRLGYPIPLYCYFDVASASFWENANPAVAVGSPNYLIVYESDSIGDPTVHRSIFGRFWTPEASYLPLIER